MTLLLLLALALPNLSLTPGAVRPLTTGQICAVRWGTDARHVSLSMRLQVFTAYGIPWDQHRAFELDHLIPRELGGADSVLNLWPQPWADARKKDREENRLHHAVCAGRLTLDAAQLQMQRWGR